MDIWDLAKYQAGYINRLKHEVKRLQATTTEPAAKPPRKKTMSLAARWKLSASWTPERKAAQSKRMAERMANYWSLEKATRPDHHPNGNGGLSL